MLAEAVRSGGSQVTCIDVMIHYPEDKMSQMVSSLASHAEERLIISFAPNTWYYRALKSFGELFPGPSKTTRACEPYILMITIIIVNVMEIIPNLQIYSSPVDKSTLP